MAQRVSGGLGSQISWHSACEGGEVVSLAHRPPLPPGMFLVLIFTRGWVNPRAMVRSEGNMSLKNTVTPPGINPGTVPLVVQYLNHYATAGPEYSSIIYWKCRSSWQSSPLCWASNWRDVLGIYNSKEEYNAEVAEAACEPIPTLAEV
jgi:hypothetical protein